MLVQSLLCKSKKKMKARQRMWSIFSTCLNLIEFVLSITIKFLLISKLSLKRITRLSLRKFKSKLFILMKLSTLNSFLTTKLFFAQTLKL